MKLHMKKEKEREKKKPNLCTAQVYFHTSTNKPPSDA